MIIVDLAGDNTRMASVDRQLLGLVRDYDRLSIVEHPTAATLHSLAFIRDTQDRLLDQRLDLHPR